VIGGGRRGRSGGWRGLRAAAALALLIAGCATSGLRPEAVSFRTRQYTLASGLRVVIEDDPGARMMGAVWVVDTGSADDPRGQAGLAHSIEHLLYDVPDASGTSDWQRLNDRGAIHVNATTQLERTIYQAFGPAPFLEPLLAIELARMSSPLGQLDDDALLKLMDRERSIVEEEARLREDQIGIRERASVPQLFPPDHPYGVAARERLRPSRPFTAAAVRAFVREHYRPESMTLVLSGPIPPAWDAQLWLMMPPPLTGDSRAPRAPRRGPVDTALSPPVPEAGLLRLQAAVAGPEMEVAWRLPGARGLGEVPLEMLGSFVSRGLAQAVARGKLPNVLHASASTLISDRGSVLSCALTLRDPGRAESTRAQLLALVGQLFARQQVVDDSDRLVLKEIALRAAFRMERQISRTLLRARLAHDSPADTLGSVLGAIWSVKPGDMYDLIQRYLTPSDARSVVLIPVDDRGSGTRTAIGASRERADPGGEASTDVVPAVPGAEGELDAIQPPPAARPARSPDEIRAAWGRPWARNAQIGWLANGLVVIALRRPGLPFVSALLGYRAAPATDTPPGARIAARFGRYYHGLSSALYGDMLAQSVSDQDNVRDEITAYGSDGGEAIAHLGEKIRTMYLRWPDDDFERWAAGAASHQRQPEYGAWRLLDAALWSGHVYGASTPVARVRQRTQADVASWIHRVERPDNAALVVVGNIDPREVIGRAQRELESAWKDRWSEPPAGPPAPVLPVRRAETQEVTVTFTPVPQRRAALLGFGCLLPPVRAPRDVVVNALSAELLRAELFERMRERERKSYAPSISWHYLWGGSSWLHGQIDTETAAAAQGLKALHDLLDPAQDRGARPFFEAAAVERARWRLAMWGVNQDATNLNAARSLFNAWKHGWAPEVLDHYGENLASVTVAELGAAFQVCRSSAAMSVLGPEPPPPPPPPSPASAAR